MHKWRQLPEDDTFRQPVESFYYGVCTRNPSTLWIIQWRWKSNHLKHARWTASNVQSYIVRIIFRSHRTGKCDLCCPRNLQIILLSLIFCEKDRLASWWRWCLCWKKVPCLSDIESCKRFQSRETIIWRSGCRWLPPDTCLYCLPSTSPSKNAMKLGVSALNSVGILFSSASSQSSSC